MAKAAKILLTVLVISVIAIPAYASGIGIGGHYSYVRNQDTHETTDMLGLLARLRGQFVGVEGSIDYRNDNLAGDVELKTWPVSASLLIYPVPALYALAGVGWYNSTLDFPDGAIYDDQTSTELGYHLGAGVEAPMSNTLSLTGDVRYQFIDYEFDDIPSSIGKVDADSFTLNAGLLIYFR